MGYLQWRSHYRDKGQSVPPLTAKKLSKIGKKREKERKNREKSRKREKSREEKANIGKVLSLCPS